MGGAPGIILINAKTPAPGSDFLSRFHPDPPNLGVGYLAAYLRSKGFGVDVVEADSLAGYERKICEKAKVMSPEWIGISAISTTYSTAVQIARLARRAVPGAGIVIGGMHATSEPEEVLATGLFDYVVRGEGEAALAQLLGDAPRRDIPALSYRSNGAFAHNPPPERPLPISSLPFPARDLLKPFTPAPGNFLRLPAASMLLSRGCLMNCTYCSKGPSGRKMRVRNIDGALAEVDMLVNQYGIREISFYDDIFLPGPEKMEQFCRALERDYNITWTCMSHLKLFRPELAPLMKRAGCYQIGFGVESGDTDILRTINKDIDLERGREVIESVRSAGIAARCHFMIGCPGETEETIKKTIATAIDYRADFAMFTITGALPGCRLYDWAKETGNLLVDDWAQYDGVSQTIKIPTLDYETLKKHHRIAMQKFYLRPSFIIKRLKYLLAPAAAGHNLMFFAGALSYFMKSLIPSRGGRGRGAA